MTLAEYFALNRGNRVRLAEKMLVPVETIDKTKRGVACSLRTALLAYQHTDCQVTPDELPISKRDRDLLNFYRGQDA